MIEQTRSCLEFFLKLSVLASRVKMRNQGKISDDIVSLTDDALEQLRVRWVRLQKTDCGQKVTYMAHYCWIDKSFVDFKDF